MSDAHMDLANPRHKRPNRLITNDAWAKPIIVQIAEDTGTPQQEVVRNVLRKGLRAMGYGEPPAPSPPAEIIDDGENCPRCQRTVWTCGDHDPTVSHQGTEPRMRAA